MCDKRVPATNNTVMVMAPTTMVVPMSGWAMISSADRAERDQHRHQRELPVAHLPAAPRQQVGGEEEQGELRQLGRLHAPTARAQPARRPADVDAHAGDQHQEQQTQRADEDGLRQGAPAPVVEPHGARHGEHCGGEPHQLLGEELPCRAVVAQGVDRRRRQHHHQADHVEHQHDGEQHDERAGQGLRPPKRLLLLLRRPLLVSDSVPRRAQGRPPRRGCRERGLPFGDQGVGRVGVAHDTARSRTARTKSSPRSAYEEYQSNEAQPGDSSTASPGTRGRRRRRRRRPSTRPSAPGAAPRTRPPPPRRRRRWPRPPSPRRRPRGSAPRSRPLFRPPAISTTESNPASAATTDAGVVALESSYQRTPPASPTSCTRWGSPANVAKTRRQASRSAPAATAAAEAARALAMSCGIARGRRSIASERVAVGRPQRAALDPPLRRLART